MNAASVALAITSTVAVRTPASTTGSASGISIRRSNWPRDMPMPSAASRTAGLIRRKAVSVLIRIGGNARMVSAISADVRDAPK